MNVMTGRFHNSIRRGRGLANGFARGFLLIAALCLVPAAGLRAQAPPAWPVLHRWPTVAGQLSYQGWPSDTGWVVYLKNTGSVTLYFQPSFRGLPANTPKSPRVQLDPNGIAILQLSCEPSSIQILSVRAGALDEGDYLQ